MRKIIKSISVITTVLSFVIFSIIGECRKVLPDEAAVYENEKISFNYFITVSSNNQSKKEIKVNSEIDSSSQIKNLTLLNIIPIKEINVQNTEKKYVIPCGTLFGIKFYTRGVCVISCNDIIFENKKMNPGQDSGLEPGDTIIKVNNKYLSDCEQLQNETKLSGGKPLIIEYERQGNSYATQINPVISDGSYHLGLWIRDSCAGLGTMTFYDPDTNRFAALGHGICDNDTGMLLPLDSAEITRARIGSITKGSSGVPGSINGYFSGTDTDSIGSAASNSEIGLYGTLYKPIQRFEPIEIANIQDVHKGAAQILCTLDDDEPKYYSIEITSVNYDRNNKTKNLQITATDNRLLEKTGGIVQGMSGSPILQNGKIVGAVTHVLITNSVKGYGIFAQNMYKELENNPF